ncbi:8-amino-7-oxononanoate synthase [Cesiribacter sp. SM1]|uniref:aminotransferase class I/II-fold pyridoxal phosphate-dependent enzyme n=1 Tax=Cesiribacter sp. SM1 TaxID=2861196 RepID=UPI001CD2207B|nr:8-amino-7-oxononanoate synthase [Cesiribacter sp. SM1]
MLQILNRMNQQLMKREQDASLRFLPDQLPAIDFASNDYLGLARSAELSHNIRVATEEYPASLHGATGSRLITGNLALTPQLEQELAAYFNAEACLLFNSGYAANQGLLSSLLLRGDTVIYDELAHACIKDGCRLSPASRFSFRHNDVDHLRQKIARAKGQVLVVVESVYSMDGDEAPLAALVELCKEYNAGLVVDEAHSTGLWGPGGAGLCVAQGLEQDVLARIYTFGKAMGVHGACVAGQEVLIRFLLNYSRTFIYTTALPAHSLLSIREAMRYRQQHPALMDRLNDNIKLFHSLLQEKGDFLQERLLPSRTPIQAVLIPGNEKVVRAARLLNEEHFMVWPILAPTVPEGEERLRICLHAHNSTDEIRRLVNHLYRILA